MNEILLSIGGGRNAWTCSVTCALGMHKSAASATRSFDISTSPQELEDIRWYVEQFAELPLAGELIRASKIRDSMENIGRGLFNAAFHGRTSEIEAVLRGTEQTTITVSSDSYQIHQLPWELLADSVGFISARGILIRRTFGNQETLSSTTVQIPLRILMVVSRPDELPVLDSRHNLTLLSVLAESAVARVDIALCVPATFTRLVQLVDEAHRAGRPFTIIHFDGHGGYDELRDRGYLCFESEIPSSNNFTLVDQVSAKAFGDLLAHRGVNTVLLEACSSSRVQSNRLASVGPSLVRFGVPNVIAMGHLINVKGSQIFAKQFLTSLCSGKTVRASVMEARLAMMQDMRRATDVVSSVVEISDWFVPQFFQCAGDSTLIPSKNARRTPKLNGPLGVLLTALTGKAGLFGRVKEVQRLMRMVMSLPIVAVSGLAGVGKTSFVPHVANWFYQTSEFPDGVVYADCQYNNDIERVLLKLKEDDESDASKTESTGNAYDDFVTLLRNRRLLLILDHVAISDADSTIRFDSMASHSGQNPGVILRVSEESEWAATEMR